MPPTPLSRQAGIALGPILFMLAILALLGAVISAGSGGFNTATVADRVTADIISQTNLIRTKIYECNLMYGTNANWDGYPQDSTTGSPGTLVSAVTCTGDPTGLQNLWSGNRVANFPPPTAGFNPWYYASNNSVGLGYNPTYPAAVNRCIYTTPVKSSGGIVAGLTNAAKKFTTATANDGQSEVNYNPASTNQRFVVWIGTPPASGATIINSCNSNM